MVGCVETANLIEIPQDRRWWQGWSHHMYDNCSRSKGQGHVTYRVVCMSARLLDINMRRAERAKLIEIPSRLWVPDFLW